MHLYHTCNHRLFCSLFHACLSPWLDSECFQDMSHSLTVYSPAVSTSIPLNKHHFFHEVFHDATSRFSVISQDYIHTTILVPVICGKMGLLSSLPPPHFPPKSSIQRQPNFLKASYDKITYKGKISNTQ